MFDLEIPFVRPSRQQLELLAEIDLINGKRLFLGIDDDELRGPGSVGRGDDDRLGRCRSRAFGLSLDRFGLAEAEQRQTAAPATNPGIPHLAKFLPEPERSKSRIVPSLVAFNRFRFESIKAPFARLFHTSRTLARFKAVDSSPVDSVYHMIGQ